MATMSKTCLDINLFNPARVSVVGQSKPKIDPAVLHGRGDVWPWSPASGVTYTTRRPSRLIDLIGGLNHSKWHYSRSTAEFTVLLREIYVSDGSRGAPPRAGGTRRCVTSACGGMCRLFSVAIARGNGTWVRQRLSLLSGAFPVVLSEAWACTRERLIRPPSPFSFLTSVIGRSIAARRLLSVCR